MDHDHQAVAAHHAVAVEVHRILEHQVAAAHHAAEVEVHLVLDHLVRVVHALAIDRAVVGVLAYAVGDHVVHPSSCVAVVHGTDQEDHL